MLKEMRLYLDRLKAKRVAAFATDPSVKSGKILSFYTRIMTKVTDSERCSVFILDPEKDTIWLKAGTGVKEYEIEVPKRDSVVGKAISSGKPVVVSELDTKSGAHKSVDEKTGFVTRNILCVPIKSPTRNEITGAFQLLNKRNDRGFTDEDVSIAQEVAEHLQGEVDSIFLEQEIFGLSERLFSAARKTILILLVSFAVVLALLFLSLMMWVSAAWLWS